jgi:putative aminopeptidase FrvX
VPDPTRSLLTDLLRLPGLPGHEAPVRAYLEAAWRPLVDDIHTTPLGSLHAMRRGSGPEPRPTLMLASHMDSVGLMVAGEVGGLLRVVALGDCDPRVLPGQPVLVSGRRQIPGMVVALPAGCLPQEPSEGALPLDLLRVDTGLPARQVRGLIRPGDVVRHAQSMLELAQDRLAAPALDNRASLAALTLCLLELQGREHAWDVLLAGTVQEEESAIGAATSAFSVQPEIAIAVDVTYGQAPGLARHKAFPLGGGPVSGWGPDVHPVVFRLLAEAAARLNVPLSTEFNPVDSATDAVVLQSAGAGIATGVLEIPVLNMHTPVEVVSLRDIEEAGSVLAEVASNLDDVLLPELGVKRA